MVSVAAAAGIARRRAHSSTAAATAMAWCRCEMHFERAESLIPSIGCSRRGPAAPTMRAIRADLMGSFRKRLLVLIIGLAVLTQTVTLVRSAGKHRAQRGGARRRAIDRGRLIRGPAHALSGRAARQAAWRCWPEDFGFREAVASGDGPTMLSAAGNNARRIGADLVLLMDTHGRVLASNAPPMRAPALPSAACCSETPAAGTTGRSSWCSAASHLPVLSRSGAHAGDHRLGRHGLRGGRCAGAQDPRSRRRGGHSRRPRTGRHRPRRLQPAGRRRRSRARLDATGPLRRQRGARRAARRHELSDFRCSGSIARRAGGGSPAEADGRRARAVSGVARLAAAHRRCHHRARRGDRHPSGAQRNPAARGAGARRAAHSARPLRYGRHRTPAARNSAASRQHSTPCSARSRTARPTSRGMRSTIP